MIEKFEKIIKELKVEGNRRRVAEMQYTESSEAPETKYTESELEALYMGTESYARKRYQRQGSHKRSESYGQRQRSTS